MTREEKIEELIKLEWNDFQNVQNEGGRASCQDDPETFAIMRRSQFVPWPEELIDSYTEDLREADAAGRNLIAEKYAWMMESTAPEQFKAIRHLLTEPSFMINQMIEEIVETQVAWMTSYVKNYPVLGGGNRVIESKDDSPYETSFETYLRGELHMYSERTVSLYASFVRRLKKEGRNLSLLIMESTVEAYGYKSLDDAEARMAAKQQK